MKHAKLGNLEVARIGLGAMGMSHGYTGRERTTTNRSARSTGLSTSG